MFKEKYTVKITIDDQTLFLKDYTTYQAILDDFPVFETTKNVRTCKRMLEIFLSQHHHHVLGVGPQDPPWTLITKTSILITHYKLPRCLLNSISDRRNPAPLHAPA